MNKAFKIVLMVCAIVLVVAISGSMIYYFAFFRLGNERAKWEAEQIEFNKIKEEIIKFDNEYREIVEEWDRWRSESVAGEIKEKYPEYILKFKSINIPEPLDEFYYKKRYCQMLWIENHISSENSLCSHLLY